MTKFKIKTKNEIDIDKKPRVYFTCHPNDFEKHFDKICNDIFRTHDCAIYYKEDASGFGSEQDAELERFNLFVVPVTFKLLSTSNCAMEKDIPYAFTEHIPVLPIMMESDIDEYYSKPDKFDKLQYLKPNSRDITEISYEEKLKNYLESVLISDEMAKRVRAAFEAYIFLSYRKKDRKYANELMRLIHGVPGCRNIAVWFDEFLTPGEKFNENIEKVLDDCKLFTLLVTPRLLEKGTDKNGKECDNYVISTELPLAQKKKSEKGTDIFAVEMEKTDKNKLSEISINDYVNSKDENFLMRLTDTVSKIAPSPDNSPEHTFLMGLAYLEGIDVEVDRNYAFTMIKQAAEKKLPEAIMKIVSMYENGIAHPFCIDSAIMWQNRLIGILESKFKKSRNENNLKTLFFARLHCAELYMQIKNYDLAEKKINNIMPYLLSRCNQNEVNTNILSCTLIAFLTLSDIYEKQGNIIASENTLEKSQKLFNNLIFTDDENETIRYILIHYVSIYLRIATHYRSLHDYEKSLEYAQSALRIKEVYLHKLNFYDELLLNEVIGDAYFYSHDFQSAEIYYSKNFKTLKKCKNDNTLLLQRYLAYANNRMGEVMLVNNKLKKAKAYFSDSYHISKKINNRISDDTENIAFCFLRFGDIYWKKRMFLTSALYYINAFIIRKKLYKKIKTLDSAMHLAYSYVCLSKISLFRKPYYLKSARDLFEILIKESICPDFYREEVYKLIDKNTAGV